MSRDDIEKDVLKRRIEALEQGVERLQEENQSWEIENKRRNQDDHWDDIMDSMEKLHKLLKKRFFEIEKFIRNPGFQHIALAIFKKLDPKTLGNCRAVSKEWKACIDQDKYWWHLQLVKCKEIMRLSCYGANGRTSLENSYPEFMKTMDHIYEKESMDNMKSFVTFMSRYRLKLIEIRSKHEWDTPLHFAADENRIDIFDLLVDSPHMKNMNVESLGYSDSSSNCQHSFLADACFKNQVEVIQYYMNLNGDKKIDFNKIPPSQNGYGCTLFHAACDSNHFEVIKLFLDRADELQIDLNAREIRDGKTPFMFAMKPEVVKLLLADERIDANAIDGIGHSALYYVSDCYDMKDPYPDDLPRRFEHQEIMDTITLLMSKSSRFDPTLDERLGLTSLHVAFSNKYYQMAEVILKNALTAGIDVNCRENRLGKSPAHIAFNAASYAFDEHPFRTYMCDIPNEFKSILKYAKEVGIDFEARDNRGRTPIHYVCDYNLKSHFDRFHRSVKEQYGIEFNLEAIDEDGLRPIDLFRNPGNHYYDSSDMDDYDSSDTGDYDSSDMDE